MGLDHISNGLRKIFSYFILLYAVENSAFSVILCHNFSPCYSNSTTVLIAWKVCGWHRRLTVFVVWKVESHVSISRICLYFYWNHEMLECTNWKYGNSSGSSFFIKIFFFLQLVFLLCKERLRKRRKQSRIFSRWKSALWQRTNPRTG